MQLARIRGTVVATQKDPSLTGVKFSIVDLLDDSFMPLGQVVASDPTQAGPGEMVFVVSGREAALALDETFNPSDYAVVGIVDAVGG